MPKRMIDTDLWNNEDIIEYFTAEDKYFWLYLLTNPHNNICGVMKSSPVLIARDMGYSKECIQNLLYRFENVHRAIIVDKETHELLILNWGKFNWNKSPDILKTVEKTMNSINSYYLKEILSEKINEVWGKIEEKQQGVNRVSTGCGQDTITIPIPNTNTNSYPILDNYNFSAEVRDSIIKWLNYKKEKKQTYKDIGLKTLLNKLLKEAEEYGDKYVIDSIDYSITNNWSGIFAPRPQATAKTYGANKAVEKPESEMSEADRIMWAEIDRVNGEYNNKNG